ncbi:MAG TPA: helicase-associated domain-containing protein [Jatrophihabitantaceae bacterium]|nr:helicase-associated domain-containing protein [Jatrophihabitantaceae bacterium]
MRTSVQRAIDGLDAARLATLEALVLTSDSASVAAAAELLPGIDAEDSIDELRAVGLVWGEDDRLHLVAHLVDAIGPYPAGLGRPAAHLFAAVSDVALVPVLRTLDLPPAGQPRSGASVAAVLADPTQLQDLLDARDPAERDVLSRLAEGPPVGVVRDALLPAALDDGTTPPHRLIAHGLLVPIDMQTVELPREVGLALRGGAPFAAVPPLPPAIRLNPGTSLDRLGTTAVLDTVRQVDALGELWSATPPAVLRAGGLGVRDLRRTARALDVDEAVAALLVEAAAAAGLVAATHGIEPVFLPTSEFDTWRRRETAQRWVPLATAWLGMTRQPSLIGQRDERDRVITPLGPDAERGTIPALRRQVIGLLADLPEGSAPADRDDVLARLAWLAPRRANAQRRLAEAVLSEADVLGVTAAGGLTGYGRGVLHGVPSAATTLDVALPELVDHFLVQPDLTVIVPGPPVPELADELAAVADLESSGGASVYRITEASVRRGLDSGHSGAGIAALFADHSRTPIPQALTYLIDDVARRHGVLRAGPATTYLRCDDEALLSRVLADRGVEPLGLRRIAPTVVIANAPVARILDVLREAGYAPAAEAPDGALVVVGADAPRAPSRPTSRLVRNRPATDSAATVGELIRRLRAGDQLAEITRRVAPTGQRIPGVTSAATLGLLRDAIRGERTIWLGYVDAQGTSSQRTIEPISMAGGTLRGHDVETGRLEAFALHHITGVGVLDD